MKKTKKNSHVATSFSMEGSGYQIPYPGLYPYSRVWLNRIMCNPTHNILGESYEDSTNLYKKPTFTQKLPQYHWAYSTKQIRVANRERGIQFDFINILQPHHSVTLVTVICLVHIYIYLNRLRCFHMEKIYDNDPKMREKKSLLSLAICERTSSTIQCAIIFIYMNSKYEFKT